MSAAADLRPSAHGAAAADGSRELAAVSAAAVSASAVSASAAVTAAVAAVTDPEYPDVSIAELGMLERVTDDGGHVVVELVPTVLGCPALRTIEADVVAAARGAGASSAEVRFLLAPVWSPDRVAPGARHRLASEYTITLRGADGRLRCPVCGSAAVRDTSAFGPARCRSVAHCDDCRNPVEVLRR